MAAKPEESYTDSILSSSSSTTATHASRYLRMVSGCTETVAEQMISVLASVQPITADSHVLDLASGPGIVTALLKRAHPSLRITAADLSPEMIAEVKTQAERNSWANVDTVEVDIRDLSRFADGSFSHVLVNFALPLPGDHDLVDVRKFVSEARRVLHPGGVLVATTWADRTWIRAFYQAALKVRPDEKPTNGLALPMNTMGGYWLLGRLEEGFGRTVEVRGVATAARARSKTELVENMLLAKGVMTKGYDEEEMNKFEKALADEMEKLRMWEDRGAEGVRIGMRAWMGIAVKGEDPEARGDVC